MEKMISIIIPAYNEERRIGNTLEEYGDFFKLKKKNREIDDFEILVAINNTKDRTEEIVKDHARKFKELKYLNFKEGGKGFAIMGGFKDALKREPKLIGFVDADMATPPEAFYSLISNIHNYDGIIASRYLKKSVVNPKPAIRRRMVSRIFNFLTRTLFLMPYKDTQCGAKIFKREAVESIIGSLGITQWAFDVDLLYQLRRKGFRIKEFPTVWNDKEYSKINFLKAGPRMAISILRLRIVHSPFRFIAKLYDKLPEWIKIHHRLK